MEICKKNIVIDSLTCGRLEMYLSYFTELKVETIPILFML